MADTPIHAVLQTRPKIAPLDPHPEYGRLSAEQPIFRVSIWEGRLSPWLVTRHADARTVLGSPAFSSEVTTPGFPSVFENPLPAPDGFFQNGRDNIRINSIHPGVFRTSLNEDTRPDAAAPSPVPVSTNAIARVGELDEVTRLVLFVASEDAGYSTGSEFVVDGGMLLGPALQNASIPGAAS